MGSCTLCIFIFTRDLRIQDNTALNFAFKNYTKVIPVFIFNKDQVSDSNKFRSLRSIEFMKGALENLNSEMGLNGKLNIIYNENYLKTIIKKMKPEGIVITRDYSPYAVKREDRLEKLAKNSEIKFDKLHDHLLFSDFILTPKGTNYKKFTPFYKTALKKTVPKPVTVKGTFVKLSFVKTVKLKKGDVMNRTELFKHVSNCKNFIKNYTKQHDLLSIPTTNLSVYLKFGLISLRELYYMTKYSKPFIRSIFWSIFYRIYYFFKPEFLVQEKKVPWVNNNKLFKAWTSAKTGFPIIDAGMRELNSTGIMHNRARLLVASFLVKDLLVDWKRGMKYFSNKLLDIDYVINVANWESVAGSAAHSMVWFRVFSPFLQAKKFDKNCEYICKWIPELKDIPPKDIHTWYKSYTKYPGIYLKPIVDHSVQKQKYLKAFKQQSKSST